MKTQSLKRWMVLVLAAATLAGCATVASNIAKHRANTQSSPYQYPEDPDLPPLASAIYDTLKASENDFSEFETTPASSERVDAYLDGIAEMVKHNAMPRDMEISVLNEHRQADHTKPILEPIFSETTAVPQEPLLVRGVNSMNSQTSTSLMYRLPYENKKQAKNAAEEIAKALQQTILSEAAGWNWKDKEAQIAERKESIEIGKQSSNEQVLRQMKEHERNLEKKLAAGGFDSIAAHYQWYPGNIDLKTGRVTNLGLAYTEDGLEVAISRMRPDQDGEN